MSTNRDFDGIARAWLDLMPDEAPDRAIAAVLQAVDTTPQVRRPWRWLPWRDTPMNRILVPIGAAAVIVVSAAVLLFGLRSQPDVGPGVTDSLRPSTAATSSPSFSAPPAGGPLPGELQARWMGGHSDIVSGTAGSSLLLDSSTLAVEQSNANGSSNLVAGATVPADGQIRLTSTNVGPCHDGEIGVYSWTLSTSGRVLTVTAVHDDCSRRATAVAGMWWQMDCRDPATNCLGDLDAGSYASQYIRPRLDAGLAWTPDFGALRYDVPAGWANYTDWPTKFGLTPSADFAQTTVGNLDPQASIQVIAQPAALKSICANNPELTVANTVEAQLAWLDQNPGLVVTQPGSDRISIDGHDGRYVDLAVVSGQTECGADVGYLLAGDGEVLTVDSNGRDRLILVDLGDGHLVAIRIHVHDASRFDDVIGAAMPIVSSFAFK
jgi:hypothetical protein